MEKRNIAIAVVSLTLGIAIGIGGSRLLQRTGELKPQAPAITKAPAKEQKKKKAEQPKKECPAVDNPTPYADVALRYIKTIKTGKSTDIYADRLSKVKDILSDSMYERLAPKMTPQELDDARDAAKKTDPRSVVTTKIVDASCAYLKKKAQEYEIYVIYEQRSLHGDSNALDRYLCRLEVKKAQNAYKIVNIYEDSQLQDGRYS